MEERRCESKTTEKLKSGERGQKLNLGSIHKKEVHLYKQRGGERAEGLVFLYGVRLRQRQGHPSRPCFAEKALLCLDIRFVPFARLRPCVPVRALMSLTIQPSRNTKRPWARRRCCEVRLSLGTRLPEDGRPEACFSLNPTKVYSGSTSRPLLQLPLPSGG